MHPFTLERPRDLAAALAFARPGRPQRRARRIHRRRHRHGAASAGRRAPARAAGQPRGPSRQPHRRRTAGPQARRRRHDGGGGGPPCRGRAVSRHLRGAAELGEPAGAQPGDDGRQPPAAHPLPVFPRCRLRRLQQARAGLRLLRHRRREPLACRARHERELHRRQRRPTLRWRWSRSMRRSRCAGPAGSARCRWPTFTACPATRRTSRRCSSRAR